MNSALLHPDMFTAIPFVGEAVGLQLEQYAATLPEPKERQLPISIVIRAMNEADTLSTLLQDLSQQTFTGETEVIVLDNESSDATRDVALEYGARVETISRGDFTYPRSLNRSMELASNERVVFTVAHAALATNVFLSAVNERFQEEGVVAAYGTTLPMPSAPLAERLLYATWAKQPPTKSIQKAGIGALGATNAVLSKSAWKELGGFDESHGMGGEDTLFAKVALSAGYKILREPLLAVHHSHGLGVRNLALQWRQWSRSLRHAEDFDKDRLAKRRPDLDFS